MDITQVASLASSLTEAPATQQVEEKPQDFLDFKYMKGVVDKLVGDFDTERNFTERNRSLRYFRGVDSEVLRNSGIIKADELYSKVRLIDTNIRREQPQYLLYITQSRRAAVFVGPDGSSVPGSELLENDFTAKARYTGWEIPFIRVIDGAQIHGYDVVEVLFDSSKPGHFSVEHVGRENLIFHVDSENIQAQEIICRRLQLTAWQLEEEARDGRLDAEQVKILVNSSAKKSEEKEQNMYEVFKVFFRKDKQIFKTYYAKECTGFLANPQPYFNGIVNVSAGKTEVVGVNPIDSTPVTDFPPEIEPDYPFFILKYVESEDPKIVDIKGRADLDESAQEASSAILSGFVNGTLRAANVYGSPASSNINQKPDAAPRQTDTVLKNGAIYDQPLNFFNTPYPDQAALNGLNQVITLNSQEQAQINYTVLNRKDSGKTATEVSAAQEENAKLSSVQVALLSIFMRQVYAYCWRMYQSRVLAGKIVVADKVKPYFGSAQVDPMTGEQLNVTPAVYQLRASGDVDVVKRAEKLQQQWQAWPVIATTPIAMSFFKDMLRNAFPEDAEKYITELDMAAANTQQAQTQLIQKLGAIVKELAFDDEGKLRPELDGMEPQLQNLQQEILAATQPAIAGAGQPGINNEA